MKRAFFLRSFSLLFALAFVCASAAQADIDPKLVGYWLFRMTPVAHWNVWHIDQKGKTSAQYIGGEDNSIVLQSEGHTIKKQGSKDNKEDMIFAMKGDDQVVLSSQGGLGMMVRIAEDRWNEMRAADSSASFAEYSDPRFALLDDKKAVFGLLANLEPAMIGSWIYAGPSDGRGIWHFQDGGSVVLKPFALPQTVQLWAVRHGNSLAVIPDALSSGMFDLKYKFVTPDEMVLTDQRGPTVLMRLANDREEELSKLKPNELEKAAEFIKLADEYTKVAGSANTAN